MLHCIPVERDLTLNSGIRNHSKSLENHSEIRKETFVFYPLKLLPLEANRINLQLREFTLLLIIFWLPVNVI